MTPEQIAAERQNRLRNAFVNNDFGEAADRLEQAGGLIENRDAFLKSSAIAGWAGAQMGRRINHASPEWQGIKDGIARGYFKNREASNVSDEELFQLISNDYKALEETEKAARIAASRGESWLGKFREAEKKVQFPTGRQERYLVLAKVAHDEFSKKIAPYRDVIETVKGMVPDINQPEGFPWEQMARELVKVPKVDRPYVLESLSLQAAQPGEETTATQRLAMEFDRGLERFLTSAATAIETAPIGAEYSEVGLIAKTPEQAQAEQERLDLLDLRDDLRDIAQGNLAPLEPVRLLGMNISTAVSSLPMTLGALVPYAGPAALVGSFQRETANEIRRQNPGMDRQTIEAIATVSAPLQALAEVASDRLLFGRLPNLKRVFTSPAFTASGIAAQLAARGTIGTGTEFAEEVAQDLIPRGIQEIASSLSEDIPDVDWQGYFRNFDSAELVAGILPLAIVGAGVGQLSDFRAGRDMARSPEMLEAAMFSPESAQEIAKAANAGEWAKAEDLMRVEWKKVNAKASSMTEVAVEASKAVQAKAINALQKEKANVVEAETALNRAQAQGLIPRVFRDAQGWAVQDNMTGDVTRTKSREEAVGLAYAELDDLAREEAQAMAKVLDTYSAGGDVINLDLGRRFLLSETGISEEAMKEAAITEGQLNGLTREESEKTTWLVLGQNRLETVNQVRRAVSDLYQGASVMDAIEEPIEGKWRMALEKGVFTKEEGIKFVEMAADFMRAPELVETAKSSDRGLTEAISDIVLVDVFGRRKDGRRGAAGAVTAGIKARLRQGGYTGKDGKPIESKFGQMLAAFRALFKQIFTRFRALAKARQEGRVGQDFEAFLDTLIGTDAQTRVEAEAIQEVGQMVEEVDNQPFSLAPARTAQDAEYLAAVEAGDMEKAQRMVDEAAKASGYNVKGYHVTSAPKFNVFNPDLSFDAGLWFTTDRGSIERGETGASVSGKSRVIETWLNPGKSATRDDYDSSTPVELAAQGFDSATLEDDIVIFSPSQIKSADPVTYDDAGNVIPLFQRFQPESQDIRFSLSPTAGIFSESEIQAIKNLKPFPSVGWVGKKPSKIFRGVSEKSGSGAFNYGKGLYTTTDKNQAKRFGKVIELDASALPVRPIYFPTESAFESFLAMVKYDALKLKRTSEFESRYGPDVAPLLAQVFPGADGIQIGSGSGSFFVKWPNATTFSLARATSLVEVADTILASRMKKPEFKEGFYIAARRRLERLAKQKNMQGQGARESQLGAIRTLNAILSAFSPAIRGEVVGGNMGFINLAELKTDDARAKEITRVLNKLEGILEREAKKYYTDKIERMLERAQLKGKPGEVKKSDFIVTVQDELNLIQLAVDLDTDEVQAGITAAEAELMTADTPEKADSAMARMHLLETFGALFDEKNTTSAEMEVASDYLEQLLKQGREARRMLDEERRNKVKAYVEAASKDVFNGEIGPDTTQEARMKAAKKSGRTLLKKFFQEGLSYDLVLRYLFGADSKTAQEFGDRFILNSNAFEDTQNERRKRLRDFSRELYKTKLGARINQKLMALDTKQANTGVTYLKGREVVTHKMDLDQAVKVVADPKAFGFTAADAKAISAELDAINTRNADPTQRKVKRLVYEQTVKTGDRVEIPLSQMDALYLSMALRQPGILEQQERYGYDQKTVDELENFLTDEAKAWREWMQEEYDAEYHVANQVYMRLFNTRMPQIKFYAPLLKNHQGNQAALDPLNSGLVAQSANPGSIKSRKARTSSLRIESALDVFWSHFNQMDYWVHMAEYLRDVQSVMLNPMVRDAVVSKHGTEGMQTLNAWITLQLGRGVGKGALVVAGNRMIRNIKSAVSMKALALNLSTTLKTLPSMLYSLGEIHLSKWPAALASGMKHWARLWNTNIIQRRLDIGGMPELRDLGNSALPMSWVNQGIKMGSYPTMYADGVFTTYSAAMAYGVSFDEAKAQVASDEMAHKYAEERTALIVSKTAQPENWTQKSLLENDASGAGTLFYLFTSDPRQKAALTFEVFNRLRKGEASLEEASRKFLAYWVLPGMMFQLANAVGRSLFKGDDDEWDVVDFATAALVGQAQGFLLIGSSVEMIVSAAVAAAAEAITGEEVKGKPFWNSPKNPLDQAAQEMVKAAQTLNEDDGKTGLEKAWQLGKAASMGMSWMTPAGAIPSTAERVFKDTSNLFYSEED